MSFVCCCLIIKGKGTGIIVVDIVIWLQAYQLDDPGFESW